MQNPNYAFFVWGHKSLWNSARERTFPPFLLHHFVEGGIPHTTIQNPENAGELSQIMRGERLELSRVAPHAPQTCAYTNSATCALLRSNTFVFELRSSLLYKTPYLQSLCEAHTIVLFQGRSRTPPARFQQRIKFTLLHPNRCRFFLFRGGKRACARFRATRLMC